MTELSDEDLAREVRGGVVSAYDQLVRRHEGRMFNFLRSKTGDPRDAEDLTQKVFVSAFRKISKYDPTRKFETWLYAIARNAAINHYRHNARRPMLYTGDEDGAPEPVDHADPAQALAGADEKRALWASIREQLNDNQFTALWLRYEEDLAVADIAESMRKTSNNIKVLLHRARERLAKCLRIDESADEALPETGAAGAVMI